MKAIRIVVIAVITVLVGVSALQWLLTGSPFPQMIIERLHNPLKVRDITVHGIIVGDGRLLRVKHVKEVPTDSGLIRAAVSNGVEVNEKGELFGLLKIWHWCGNDPVRYHVARVNLSTLALACGGKPDSDVPPEICEQLTPLVSRMQFDRRGLRMGLFLQIQMLQRLQEHLELERNP